MATYWQFWPDTTSSETENEFNARTPLDGLITIRLFDKDGSLQKKESSIHKN